jgi:hypothetical protein
MALQQGYVTQADDTKRHLKKIKEVSFVYSSHIKNCLSVPSLLKRTSACEIGIEKNQ